MCVCVCVCVCVCARARTRVSVCCMPKETQTDAVEPAYYEVGKVCSHSEPHGQRKNGEKHQNPGNTKLISIRQSSSNDLHIDICQEAHKCTHTHT